MKTLADTDIQAFALIHWLGVEVVQQVVRVAVAVSAHHHQGNEGGQENGGQHPNGHDHHRLHGDSGSHGGCRQQLVSWQKKKKKESNQGRLIVRARLFMGAHLSRGEESMVSVWLGDNKPEKSDIIVTLEDVSSRNLKMKRHALLSQAGEENTIRSVLSVCKCGTPTHPHTKLIFIWAHKEVKCPLFALCRA